MFLAFLVIGFVVLVTAGRKTLAGLVHLLSLLLVLPSFLFAAACLVLDRAVTRRGAGGILAFLEVILAFIKVMLPWGILVLIVA